MTPDELAADLCRANHPELKSTGQRTPCATHIMESRSYHALLAPNKRKTLRALVKAAKA